VFVVDKVGLAYHLVSAYNVAYYPTSGAATADPPVVGLPSVGRLILFPQFKENYLQQPPESGNCNRENKVVKEAFICML
jgi:hypothetical protein